MVIERMDRLRTIDASIISVLAYFVNQKTAQSVR